MSDNSNGTSRALVLGAGGITGIAWQLGLLAGLAERGVDLSTADLVVGTSAGAVVGAQLLGGVELERRYHRELEGARGEKPTRMRLRDMARLGLATYRAESPLEARRRIGALALAVRTESEQSRRETVASWLDGVDRWPDAELRITAVDASSGVLMTFDRSSGADLLGVVAASCASPGVRPPSTVGGRRFIDGGVHSPINADLATGYDRVVVLAPLEEAGDTMASPADEVVALRSTAARVAFVVPDESAREGVGRTLSELLKPARRTAAAKAGHEQAGRVATEIERVWTT